MLNAENIVEKLSVDEKIRLLSGKNFWQTFSFGNKIPVLTMSDGPCGLRKQDEHCDNLGLNTSVKATCFPCPTNLASTFDRTLCRTVADAIAKECISGNVNMLLAPAMNIKRNPLCGRNFEYFSEDTFLTSEMAAAFVSGIQENNVGACLKHFACNNQEDNRMQLNCVVSERAINEIYLKAFCETIKRTRPAAVMASYNKINGAYVSENPYILDEILRKSWGYDGMVVSDWGGVNDRVYSLKAGLDLEMPSSLGSQEKYIARALKKGRINIEQIDTRCKNIIKTALEYQGGESAVIDYVKHDNIARIVAGESAVLLKNDNHILPLSKDAKVAIIGEFAKTPRYQGNGSSIVNSYKVTNFLDEMNLNRLDYSFAKGFRLDKDEVDDRLVEQAVILASSAEYAVVFAGLPESCETEGVDRRNIELPQSQNYLIERIVAANPNTVVVLSCGSIVNMPWVDKVGGIVNMQLAGQASGGGIYDVLFGIVNPSGRTNQSFVKDPNYLPGLNYFDFNKKLDEYKDDLFVGYRYFDWEDDRLLFPFGYGLSYTEFSYENLKAESYKFKQGDKNHIRFDVTNVGAFDGSEVCQVYVELKETRHKIEWVKHELKEFDKKFIERGKTAEFRFIITDDFFSYYNDKTKKFEILEGVFNIVIGSTGRDRRFVFEVSVSGTADELPVAVEEYVNFSMETVRGNGFKKLTVRDCAEYCPKEKGRFNQNSSINDLQITFIGRVIKKVVVKQLTQSGMQECYELMKDNPLRSFISTSNGAFSRDLVNALITCANGHYFIGSLMTLSAVRKMKKKDKKQKKKET